MVGDGVVKKRSYDTLTKSNNFVCTPMKNMLTLLDCGGIEVKGNCKFEFSILEGDYKLSEVFLGERGPGNSFFYFMFSKLGFTFPFIRSLWMC